MFLISDHVDRKAWGGRCHFKMISVNKAEIHLNQPKHAYLAKYTCFSL